MQIVLIYVHVARSSFAFTNDTPSSRTRPYYRNNNQYRNNNPFPVNLLIIYFRPDDIDRRFEVY